MWKWSLAAVSWPISLLKRSRVRLAKLFEHNIRVRSYDCSVTSAALRLDLDFDWRKELRRLYHVQPPVRWPEGTAGDGGLPQAQRVLYVGFGRIVRQKHLPALERIGFKGAVTALDTLPPVLPKAKSYSIELAKENPAQCDHAVITAPWKSRSDILRSTTARFLLLEKPFAVSRAHLEEMRLLCADRRVWVLHNYRLKNNARKLRQFVQKYSSGELRHVTLRFETPTPFIEKSAWMRRERENRILLTDYSLHFLDLAWLFFEGAMTIRRLKVTDNDRGELESVAADLSFENGNCTLLIRQGCHRREAHIQYCFQNYDAHLRFFPDVFRATFGGHSAFDDVQMAIGAAASTTAKIGEKLGLLVADRSHDELLASFVGLEGGCELDEFSVDKLLPFYERLTQLADAAYS